MKQYLELLKHIKNNGKKRGDRTGTGTVSVFGYQTRFDLEEGFPLVTTKKCHLKSIIHELLWFLKGDTNIKYLNDNGVRIWDDWADANGDLGPIYGAQWRSWPDSEVGDEIDQIKKSINRIKYNPNCRRNIVTAWNPSYLPDDDYSPNENPKYGLMALAPCHTLFQFYVDDGRLSCQLYQRSADAFLGVPFNIASYALLTMMIAQVCGLKPGEFIHTFGDLHIYQNHLKQVDEQLSRKPKSLPTMVINPGVKNIDDFVYNDFELIGYNSHPTIKGEISK